MTKKIQTRNSSYLVYIFTDFSKKVSKLYTKKKTNIIKTIGKENVEHLQLKWKQEKATMKHGWKAMEVLPQTAIWS